MPQEDKGMEFDDLTDKEMEEPIEKGPTKTLVEKKNGARKKLTKPDALAVGGGAKKRMVQAILSPRKKTAPKGRKVMKEMGSSHLNCLGMGFIESYDIATLLPYGVNL